MGTETQVVKVTGPPTYQVQGIPSETEVVGLSEGHKGCLDDLRGRIQRNHHLTKKERRFADDRCLLRYLRARDWDVDKAEAQLLATLKWHSDFKIHGLHPNMFVVESATGKLYRNGFDKLGRPVVYMKPRFENTRDYDNQIRHFVDCFERTIESMDLSRGVETLVLIIDFEGQSMSQSFPIGKGREVLDIIMTCYPERLGMAILVDAPFFFSMFWTAVSPFIPPVTKSKIKFCHSPRKGRPTPSVFLEHFDLDALEHDFGGTTKFEYNYDVYWEHERALYEARKAREQQHE